MNVFKKLKDRLPPSLTYDYTMQDVVGEEKFNEMKSSDKYRKFADWLGLASNKIVLGMYIDASAGLTVGTSLIARGVAIAFHSPTSPPYTKFRELIYKKGNITPERARFWKEGADFLAYSIGQTTIYTTQIAIVLGARALMNDSIGFDSDKVYMGAYKFFINSWWLAPVARWSMNGCRRFFGTKTPEQLAVKEKGDMQPQIRGIAQEGEEPPINGLENKVKEK